MAQSADPALSLAARSAIVVLGTVTRAGASEEPLLPPSAATVVIRVDRMLAGSEIAGDQAGHVATVILSRPGSLKAGSQALFFGNPRFIGKTLTIADEGELPPPEAKTGALPPALAQGLQARRDIPIRARLAVAEMVFLGSVEDVRQLEGAEGEGPKRELRDEHDPDWWAAMVRVRSSLRGAEDGALVPIVFPASRDIVWLNSPKLASGDQALVLAHRPQEEELLLLRSTGVLRWIEQQHALLVTQPFDVLAPAEEKRVAGLLQNKEVQR